VVFIGVFAVSRHSGYLIQNAARFLRYHIIFVGTFARPLPAVRGLDLAGRPLRRQQIKPVRGNPAKRKKIAKSTADQRRSLFDLGRSERRRPTGGSIGSDV
jgi:hypothetical protein